MSKFAIIYLVIFGIALAACAQTESTDPKYETPFIAKHNSVKIEFKVLAAASRFQ